MDLQNELNEDRKNIYLLNDTMKMLGKNCYMKMLGNVEFEELENIIIAHRFPCTKELAMDLFVLGYIHGKRAERARRKKVGAAQA